MTVIVTTVPTRPVPAHRFDAHVVPVASGHWAVKIEGRYGYHVVTATQLEATANAIHYAREAAASVILHGRDGRFRTVWSY